MGGEDAEHCGVVVDLQLLGALDGAPELMGWDDGGEVEERSGGSGYRQTVVLAELPWVQVDRTMDAQIALRLATTIRRDRQLEERAAPRPQSPLPCRAAMAQHGVIADRQHCGERVSLPA